MHRARRWGDNDRQWGPFLYSNDGRYRTTAMVLMSMDDEDEGRFNTLRFSALGHTVLIFIPQIIKPWRQWVDTSKYEWSNGKGYWDIHQRYYGFSASEGFVQLFFGAQTHDSRTDQNKGWFIPWTQWRHVRHSMYDLNGNHFWTEAKRTKGAKHDFDAWHNARQAVPAMTFDFADFDGEELNARTYIEEREWLLGEGWFKWLSIFRRPKIIRSLHIEFSGETGERKGSWKGGTIGHSIEMTPGELHEEAFRRYCEKHAMAFMGETVSP